MSEDVSMGMSHTIIQGHILLSLAVPNSSITFEIRGNMSVAADAAE